MKIRFLLFVWLLALLASAKSKDKCKICKEFSKSFKEEFDNTAKSNYAGGDTAWEEEKLGSYANSEVRFVEIMENVCDRSDHDCHSLVSNNEEAIEEWWLQGRHKGEADIELWFCHTHLEACCPDNTFGRDCQPCPGGIDKPCNDHGTCEGAGKRDGKGTCDCYKGYTGELCDQCSIGYYNESNSCIVCHMSCELECSGAGPKGCAKCKSGWSHDPEIGCKDINECADDTAVCDDDTYCLNAPGSYSCKDCDFSCEDSCSGPGNKACDTCAEGYFQSEDGACLDKDECNESSTPLCKEGTYCDNTPGSYRCQACHVSCALECIGPGRESCVECKKGYEQLNGSCEDVDECKEENTCNNETEICDNLPGTFMCKCKPGYEKVEGKCEMIVKKPKKKNTSKSRKSTATKPTPTEDDSKDEDSFDPVPTTGHTEL